MTRLGEPRLEHGQLEHRDRHKNGPGSREEIAEALAKPPDRRMESTALHEGSRRR